MSKNRGEDLKDGERKFRDNKIFMSSPRGGHNKRKDQMLNSDNAIYPDENSQI